MRQQTNLLIKGDKTNKPISYLVRIEEEVAEFAGEVELFNQFILHHPGGTFTHAQPQGIMPDEVTHDLLGRRTLCSEQTVYWDVADHL